MRCSKCKQEIKGKDKYIKALGFILHKKCVSPKVKEILKDKGKC